MESLRQRGELTPEQEVQLMKQQLEAVKQDCAKLASIQAENSRLKKELEALKGGATAAKGAGAAGKKNKFQVKLLGFTFIKFFMDTQNQFQMLCKGIVSEVASVTAVRKGVFLRNYSSSLRYYFSRLV